MSKIIYSVLIGLFLASSVSAFGYGVDSEPRYNDEYGWFFYIGFPYTQDIISFILLVFPNMVDGIWLEEETINNVTTIYTMIDVNDFDYMLYEYTRNQQIDQLTFVQWYNYITHAYRLVSPLDALYVWGYDAQGEKVEPVECKPYDLNGNHVYEMICLPAT